MFKGWDLEHQSIPEEVKINRILLIRSAPMYQFTQALEFLRCRFPDAKISILIQPGVRNVTIGGVYEEILFPYDGVFNIFRASPNFIRGLRTRNFDAIAILYNNPCGDGYYHLRLLTYLMAPKNVIIYDNLNRGYLLPIGPLKTILKAEAIKRVFSPLLFLLVFSLIGVKSIWRFIHRIRDNDAHRD